jgi:tRNA dimethylallyltransferase
MSANLITILGPTASGKTRLAVRLAKDLNGEIISADSRQVYRGMDIGTGKDIEDYIIDGSQIEYHLIDIIDPEDEFNLFEFKRKFYQIFDLITLKGKLPFLAGGTGLYISSIIQNYKLKKADFTSDRAEELRRFSLNKLQDILISKRSDLHNKSDLSNKERIIRAILIEEAESEEKGNIPVIDSVVIGIKVERETIKKRITDRLKKRLNTGMIEEVENLIKSGVSFERLDYFGLEYRYIGLYLKGELNYDDMFRKLNHAIHNFAKRQMTWFRKMEREGIIINWIEAEDYIKAKQIIMGNLNV